MKSLRAMLRALPAEGRRSARTSVLGVAAASGLTGVGSTGPAGRSRTPTKAGEP